VYVCVCMYVPREWQLQHPGVVVAPLPHRALNPVGLTRKPEESLVEGGSDVHLRGRVDREEDVQQWPAQEKLARRAVARDIQ
jgi:hypothetical protein